MWLGFFFQFSFSLSVQHHFRETLSAGWPANASQKHTAYANSTNHPTQSGLSLSLCLSLFLCLCLSIFLGHSAVAGGSTLPLIKVNCAKARAAHCQGFSD